MVFVDDGRNAVRDFLDNNAPTGPTHMAWGSSSTSVTQTDSSLGGETTRSTFDLTSATDKQIQYQDVLTSAVTSGTFAEVGIFNSSSAGTMFLRQTFTGITKTSTNELQADVFVSIIGDS